MAKYKLLEKSFINGSLRPAGEIVEYDGKAGKNLELVKERGRPKANPDPVPTPSPEAEYLKSED